MANYNATDWTFNPDYEASPYIYDDDRYLYDASDLIYNGSELDPEFTPVKPTDWDNI